MKKFFICFMLLTIVGYSQASDDCSWFSIKSTKTEICTENEAILSVSINDIPQQGLVSYWPFNENIEDESGNGNTLTNSGATLTADRNGTSNNAHSFDGSSSMTFETSESYINFTDGITVSVWFYLTSSYNANPRMFYVGQTDQNNKGIHLMVQNGKIGYVVSPGNGLGGLGAWSGVNPVPTEAWHHALFRADFSTGSSALFIDGQLANSGTNTNQGLLDALRGIDYSKEPGNIGQKTGGNDKWKGKLDDIIVWNRPVSDNEVLSIFNAKPAAYLWSTGETTKTISVSPTETTKYWVDVITNGVTCREYITIDVTAPKAPKGDALQTFCTTPKVDDLVATGEDIQWYDAATEGNLLDANSALSDGQVVYASQIINGCESTERLDITIAIPDVHITSSDTKICSGEEVTITLDYQKPTICDMDITLTDIPFGEEISGFTYGGYFNGHYYYVYNSPTTWTDGERIARENGGYLVCINNEEENSFVSNLTNNNIWIGMFRDPESGEFRWLDCIDIAYTNWRPGEPNNGPFGEPYVQIIRGCSFGYNTWNNLSNNASNGSCYSNMVPIMEIDPTIYEQSFIDESSIIWSTGATTETISVKPTETTEYWVDVTTNGVTCREYITIEVTAPSAPTGESLQTFCIAAILADLGATGENIQWYDAATEGNLLAATAALSDSQVVYASQTVNGCESTDRLKVTVDIQDIAITTSATKVCAGDRVSLSIDNETTNSIGDTIFIESFTMNFNNAFNYSTSITTVDTEYMLKVSGGPWGGANGDSRDAAYWLPNTTNKNQLIPEIRWGWSRYGGICKGSSPHRPSPDVYNSKGDYYFYFKGEGGREEFCFTDSRYSDNYGNLFFELFEIKNSTAFDKVLWSTNDTTKTISISPTETTEYWVDVTTNGITCREYITIEATAPTAPIGDTEQSFCNMATISDLKATGENIKWYDSANGGTLMNNSVSLTDGQLIYATQTVDGCESLQRLEVEVIINAVPTPSLITSDLVFCIAQEATLADIEVDTQGFTLEWYNSPNGGEVLSKDTPLKKGVAFYAALYDNKADCKSLTRLEVIPSLAVCEVIVHNAISPNGDRLNDKLVISNIKLYPKNKLVIFNRWGQTVYEADNYGQNGKYFEGKNQQNELLPAGIYFYYLQFETKTDLKKIKGELYINY